MALSFSVINNQMNYCFPRYNAVTNNENKMWCYYSLIELTEAISMQVNSLSAIVPAKLFLWCVCLWGARLD